MLVVDAANVIGAVPDGWWRDRAGAAVRLHDRLRVAVSTGRLFDDGVTPPVVLVLEGAARAAAPPGESDGVQVRHAPRDGDDEVRRVVAEAADDVWVVTADRRLAADCAAVGARVVGPRWLLERLR
jgi:hypothetical protein